MIYRVSRSHCSSWLAAASALALVATTGSLQAAPPIRTGAANSVPACTTPERLMAFLTARNRNLNPRFADIARLYKQWGEAWRVRWDYAFFQMAIETNYLSYRRPNGRYGDVRESQNNFAGIGATGGGVPGDRFVDVSSGVHAQIQHLVAYSGQRLAAPIAARTTAKQSDIVEQSLRLNRPVTFGDLARRWAVDRHYARSIDFVAGQFQSTYCKPGETAAADDGSANSAAPRRGLPKPSGLGGPKPAKLAGPQTEPAQDVEILPWSNLPAEGAPANASPPPKLKSKTSAAAAGAKKKKPQPVAAAPVRTLWSRSADPVQLATQQVPVGAVAAEPPAPPAQVHPTALELPLLPWFRIAPEPAVAPPSRLGGPLPLPDPQAQVTGLSAPGDGLAAASPPCRVLKASYGGRKTLLVRSTVDKELRLTALTVLDGFEKTMFDTYARAAAPGAEIVGEYENDEAALADARANCPDSW